MKRSKVRDFHKITPERIWYFHIPKVGRTFRGKEYHMVTAAVAIHGVTAYMGIAKCSTSEPFCKRKGRDIATGRMKLNMAKGYGVILSDRTLSLLQQEKARTETVREFVYNQLSVPINP